MIRLLFRVTGEGGAVTLHSAEVHGSKSALLLRTPIADIIGFEDCREQDVPMRVKDERAFGNWIRHQWGPTHRGGVSATWKPDDGGIPIPPNVAAEIENVFKDGERSDVVYTPGEPEIPCGGPDAVLGQEIPKPESIGFGATAMGYRELYEQKEIQPADAVVIPEGSPVNPATQGEYGKFIAPGEFREFTTKKLPEFVVIDDPVKEGEASPTAESVAEYVRDTIASRVKKAEDEAKDEDGEDSRKIYGSGLTTKLWLLMRPSGEFVKSTTEEGGESYISCTSHEEAVKVAEHQKVFDIECVPYRVF